MPERTIDWGGDNSPYETHFDRDDNGRLVVAEDTTGATVLLEYVAATDTWVSRGAVDLDGNDLQNAGAVDATSVNTGDLDTGRTWQDVTSSRSFDQVYTNGTQSEIEIIGIAQPDADTTRIGLFFEIDGQERPVSVRETLDTDDRIPIQCKVPTGSDYEIGSFDDTASFSLRSWFEFRP